MSRQLEVKIAPFGITPERAATLRQTVLKNKAVSKYLGTSRNRLLSFEVLDSPDEETKRLRPQPPNRFRATFFDYAKNRTVIGQGSLTRPSTLKLTESGTQPWPSAGEFEEALKILVAKEEELGVGIRENRLRPYRPMPPLISEEQPHGTIERVVAVGLLPSDLNFVCAAALALVVVAENRRLSRFASDDIVARWNNDGQRIENWSAFLYFSDSWR
jgi:hypothetical protein